MWEDLAIAVSTLGFLAALGLMLIELPAVVGQARVAVGRRWTRGTTADAAQPVTYHVSR